MTNDVSKKLVEIIAEQAMVDPSEIDPDADLDDLGLDSLALVEIVFAIEEAFEVSVPYNANDPSESDFELTSITALTEAVNKLIAATGDT